MGYHGSEEKPILAHPPYANPRPQKEGAAALATSRAAPSSPRMMMGCMPRWSGRGGWTLFPSKGPLYGGCASTPDSIYAGFSPLWK